MVLTAYSSKNNSEYGVDKLIVCPKHTYILLHKAFHKLNVKPLCFCDVFVCVVSICVYLCSRSTIVLLCLCRREDVIKNLEIELKQEKSMTDTLISDMVRKLPMTSVMRLGFHEQKPCSFVVSCIRHILYLLLLQNPNQRHKYMQCKDLNEQLLKQLEDGQQELDKLVSKKKELEEELSASPVKQEAGIHYLNSLLQCKTDIISSK